MESDALRRYEAQKKRDEDWLTEYEEEEHWTYEHGIEGAQWEPNLHIIELAVDMIFSKHNNPTSVMGSEGDYFTIAALYKELTK